MPGRSSPTSPESPSCLYCQRWAFCVTGVLAHRGQGLAVACAVLGHPRDMDQSRRGAGDALPPPSQGAPGGEPTLGRWEWAPQNMTPLPQQPGQVPALARDILRYFSLVGVPSLAPAVAMAKADAADRALRVLSSSRHDVMTTPLL